MGLDGLMGRSIFDISGDEKQKVACASVAALQPDVLVPGEPSSNLDMRAIADLRWQIARWKRQGKAIIIAEHRLFYYPLNSAGRQCMLEFFMTASKGAGSADESSKGTDSAEAGSSDAYNASAAQERWRQ
jgi:energy-coupling factor transport system ATP-binding protein